MTIVFLSKSYTEFYKDLWFSYMGSRETRYLGELETYREDVGKLRIPEKTEGLGIGKAQTPGDLDSPQMFWG